MNLSKGSTQNIETSIYPVTFRVYSYATVDSRTENRLANIISDSARLLRSYATDMNLPFRDCAGDQVIEFFIVPYSVLNDRSRFSEWPYENGAGSESSNIVALFSPRRTERNIDAMLFTSSSFYQDHYVAHELAHYWYERLCWSSSSRVRTEPFAMAFESYYLSNRRTPINGNYSTESHAPVVRGDNQDANSDSYYVPTIRSNRQEDSSNSYYVPTIRGGRGRGGGR